MTSTRSQRAAKRSSSTTSPERRSRPTRRSSSSRTREAAGESVELFIDISTNQRRDEQAQQPQRTRRATERFEPENPRKRTARPANRERDKKGKQKSIESRTLSDRSGQKSSRGKGKARGESLSRGNVLRSSKRQTEKQGRAKARQSPKVKSHRKQVVVRDEINNARGGTSDFDSSPEPFLSPSDEEDYVAQYRPAFGSANDGDNDAFWIELPSLDELNSLSEIEREGARQRQDSAKRGRGDDVVHAAGESSQSALPRDDEAQQSSRQANGVGLDDVMHADKDASTDLARGSMPRAVSIPSSTRSASFHSAREVDDHADRSAASTSREALHSELHAPVDASVTGRDGIASCTAAGGAGHARSSSSSIRAYENGAQRIGNAKVLHGEGNETTHRATSSKGQGKKPEERASMKRSRLRLTSDDSEEGSGKKRSRDKRVDVVEHRHKKTTGTDSAKRYRIMAKRRRLEAAAKDEMGNGEMDDSDSDNDLRQDLNIDAFVRSRSSMKASQKRAKRLEQLRRAKQGGARSDSPSDNEGDSADSSDSSDGSSSDDDLTSSVSSSDGSFVVEDDDSSKQGLPDMHPGAMASSLPAFGTHSSTSVFGNARLSFQGKCKEYTLWVIILMLDATALVPVQRLRQLERVRASLREDLRMDYLQLTSQSTRRQFGWYLKHYPYFEKREAVRDEVKGHRGCAACKRASQQCEFAFSLWGRLYDTDSLHWRSPDSESESDISTDREDEKIAGINGDGEDVHTFFLGGFCSQKAAIMHRLLHWERRLLRDISKQESYKRLRRKHHRNLDENEAGASRSPPITLEELEKTADDCRHPVVRLINRLKKGANDVRLRAVPVNRGRERWDDGP